MVKKKPKRLRKVQKMTVLQAWEIYKMFLNTRYICMEVDYLFTIGDDLDNW